MSELQPGSCARLTMGILGLERSPFPGTRSRRVFGGLLASQIALQSDLTGELTWCPLPQRSVRTALIVFPPPAFDDLLGLGQGHEPVHIQTLGSKRAIERLHVRIVRGLSRARKIDLYPVVVSPKIHDLTGELRSVVTEQ